MAYRSIATNSVSSSSLVVDKPAGVISGDLLIAFGATDGGCGTYTWPAGFTAITGAPVESTFDAQCFGAAYKIAGGSEPATYTIGASAALIGGIVAFSGPVGTTPHRSSAVGSGASGNASPWNLPASAFGTNTTTTCDLIFLAGSDVNASTDVSHAAPSGMTLRADINSGFINAMVATLDAAASGESGARTGTGTAAGQSAGYGVVMVAWEVSAGTTAALTGTITTATEADIVAGGQTIILTLTGGTWVT